MTMDDNKKKKITIRMIIDLTTTTMIDNADYKRSLTSPVNDARMIHNLNDDD